jgi:hypothetical protein
MKKLLSTIALCAVMSPAAALTIPKEACALFGDIAGAVMEAHQRGISIAGPLASIPADTPPEWVEYIEAIVSKAREEPIWYSDGMRQKAVDDFVETFELDCYSQ